jgi:hypothetical protein
MCYASVRFMVSRDLKPKRPWDIHKYKIESNTIVLSFLVQELFVLLSSITVS